MEVNESRPARETFSSVFGVVMTMIGAAVGLGAFWRFPYMAGRFGGSAFVLFYMLITLFIGIPALMAEWTLGRHTRRGTLGCFEKGGFPGGRWVGFSLFAVLIVACGYYSNVVGWVAFHTLGQVLQALGLSLDSAAILPPQEGFSPTSLLLQLLMTAAVIFSCGIVIVRGLRKGIEKTSKWIVPLVFGFLVILILRSVTLKGAGEGIRWFILKFRWSELTPGVMAAALGMAFFCMSLGGTFMVMYGSYLDKKTRIPRNAVITGVGASMAGILAGLAIFPAVFSFGLEPGSGPGLIFMTLPKTFALMPFGWFFGILFFAGLFGIAYLSDVAAFEVLVGGVVDNTNIPRKKAVFIICGIVFILSLPPMINDRIFIPWDLAFGSGMQALGSLLAVITAVWFIKRSEALKELAAGMDKPFPRVLYWWMRVAVPLAILLVGINWLLESVFKVRLTG
ncbi:MAG: sodium-dependent transporter [Candidatus Aminicenantes bacterium]|nr:sodium-dependent transporter [Candidatus Aminicenantes bacterium]